MIRMINKYEFRDAFMEGQYKNNFSYEGLAALFEYLEELEESTDGDIELDVVAIACDFAEYECFECLNAAYGDKFGSIEDLEDYTTVIEVGQDTDRIIIQQF